MLVGRLLVLLGDMMVNQGGKVISETDKNWLLFWRKWLKLFSPRNFCSREMVRLAVRLKLQKLGFTLVKVYYLGKPSDWSHQAGRTYSTSFELRGSER